MARSKPVRSRRVSYRTMRKHLTEIAGRHFSAAFNDMFAYAVVVNPRGHSFLRQYLGQCVSSSMCTKWPSSGAGRRCDRE